MNLNYYTNLKIRSFLIFIIDLIVYNIISFKIYSLIYRIDTRHGLYLIKIQIFWFLLSYISGRYAQYNISFKKWLKKYIERSLLTLFLFTNFIFIKILFFREAIYRPDLISIFIILSLISIVSLIILSINYKIIQNSSKKNIWVYIGSKYQFEKFKKSIVPSNHEFIIKNFKNTDTFLKTKSKLIYKLRGIIIKKEIDFSTINLENLNTLQSKIEIYTEIDWIKEFLQRIPSKLISKEEFIISNLSPNIFSIQIRIKRISDIVLSLIIIIISSPLLLLAILFIYLEDRGPIFYSQIRNGLGEKNIKILKLRTMIISAEKLGPQWSRKNDPRITKIGKLLRRIRLDELPQLISVIKGDMSLIGPRPERPVIDHELEKKILHYKTRYLIKPGLSGWAQVNYPYGASIKDAEIKLSYDLYYLYNISLWIDFLILIKTIKLVLSAKGAISKN